MLLGRNQAERLPCLKSHSGLRLRHVFDSDTNQVFDPEWSSPGLFIS